MIGGKMSGDKLEKVLNDTPGRAGSSRRSPPSRSRAGSVPAVSRACSSPSSVPLPIPPATDRPLARDTGRRPPEEALAFFDCCPGAGADCSAGGGGAGCPPARRWTGCSRPTAGTARSSSAPSRCTRCCSPAAAGGRGRSTPRCSRWPAPRLRRAGAPLAGCGRRSAASARCCTRTGRRRGCATVEHRGVDTAAMVYDALPIIDVFRRVGDDVRARARWTCAGWPAPFFFLLERDAGD